MKLFKRFKFAGFTAFTLTGLEAGLLDMVIQANDKMDSFLDQTKDAAKITKKALKLAQDQSEEITRLRIENQELREKK